TTLTATASTSTGGVISTNWTQNSQPYTPSSSLSNVSGINDLGTYQVGIRETWPSGLFCSALSQTVTITANVSNRLFIFPSPNDGNFTVSYYYSGSSASTRVLNIYDGKGALVYRESFSVAGPYTLLPVDLRQHARGIYYVVVGDAAGNKLIQGKVHVR
ncbi:MAG: T9SS C-terminal target domain-containing protein, partial [Chitinophagaceae bacterium]|nr:T9SS C-terminal target domain-containing protein [Chitinophagaceae bacterium]